MEASTEISQQEPPKVLLPCLGAGAGKCRAEHPLQQQNTHTEHTCRSTPTTASSPLPSPSQRLHLHPCHLVPRSRAAFPACIKEQRRSQRPSPAAQAQPKAKQWQFSSSCTAYGKQAVSSITLKQKHPRHHRQEHSVAVSTISQPRMASARAQGAAMCAPGAHCCCPGKKKGSCEKERDGFFSSVCVIGQGEIVCS